MEVSSKGLDFITRHEGFVSRAYRDPVGIVTIGTGFTNASKVATAMLGPIRMGMTITREQNDAVLRAAIREEYGPPVAEAMPGAKRHQFDAGVSYCFNCGPGAVKGDRWTAAFREGKIGVAASLLRSSRITARGKKLPGLVRRRNEEAALFEFGDYGRGSPAHSEETAKPPRQRDELLREYQEKLTTLGYPCPVNGWHDAKTTAAVKAFQKNQPNLTVDGLIGPATRAAIDRAIQARKDAAGGSIGAGGAVAGGGAVLAAEPQLWPYVVAILAVLLIAGAAWLYWKHRDEIWHWWKG